jgi:hypothetical protein
MNVTLLLEDLSLEINIRMKNAKGEEGEINGSCS